MFDSIFYQAILSLQQVLIKNTSGELLQELTTQVKEVIDAFDEIKNNYEILLEEDPSNHFLKFDDFDRIQYLKYLEEENNRIYTQLEKDGLIK